MAVTPRIVSRAVLLTPDERILLMKVQEPVSRSRFWLTPGGGIDPGETGEAGLRRELAEETGLVEPCIGPPLWIRPHDFAWNGRTIRQVETFFLVETDLFEPTMANNPEAAERGVFRGFRWWSALELRASAEAFAPSRLAGLIERLIASGPPAVPFEIGI